MRSPLPRQSWPAPLAQAAHAEGCHPFSVHLICLKTTKKNHSRLSASAATVIYGLHQSPLPPLAPSFSPELPKAGPGRWSDTEPANRVHFHRQSGDYALSLWREGSVDITDHCCVASGNSCHLSVS